MDRPPFVDAHVHFWRLDHLRYAWLTPPFADDGPNGSVEAIARDYLPADHQLDVAGWNMVDCVHVDAGADADQAFDETRWLNELADAEASPGAIVAFARLDAPDAAAALAVQAAQPRVRGIRQIVNWHPDQRRTYTPRDLTREPAWWAGYALLARHGLSFDLQCYPAQMPTLAAGLARHPDVPVIVNHLGMPVLTDPDGLADWRHGMTALAALPHVHVKLSGLGFADRLWTPEQVRPLLLEAISLFGPRRCLVASDAPTDKLFAPIAHHLEAYEAVTADLSADERRDLWGRNANRVYRLGLDI
jgi:predicted TIM-barrel fold metal-dependent hydrolase